MSMISKDGYEQILIIKNALDSMFDKLEANGTFSEVQTEFESIADIVDSAGSWTEV